MAWLVHVRLAALTLQAQWRRQAATRTVALRRREPYVSMSRGMRLVCAKYYPLRRQQVKTARHVRQQMTTAQVLDAVVSATPRGGNNNKSKTRAIQLSHRTQPFISLQSSSSPRSLLPSLLCASSPPPPSWIVVKDPTSGETYYYNSGVIQWIMPVGPAAQG